MVVGPDQPHVPIGIARAEEGERNALRRVGRVLARHRLEVQFALQRMHGRADEGAVLAEKVDALRRDVDVLGMAGLVVPGRQELRAQHARIEQRQKHARPDGDLVLAELPPHQRQLAGEVDALLLGGEAVDRLQVERRGRDEVRQRLGAFGRQGRAVLALAHLVGALVGAGGELVRVRRLVDRQRRGGVLLEEARAHRSAPPDRRMRGSRKPSAMSETRTPMTVSVRPGT